jgi:DNA polymerase III alpha subunit (gram-positive type)
MSTQTYNGYKHFFLDVETTGTDRALHNIFQISGILTDENYNILEECNLMFRPYSLEHWEQGALDKTGMTLDDLAHLECTSEDAYIQLSQLLSRHCNKFDKKDKIHFVAYNAAFDADFIRAWFAKHGDNYFGSWFWHPQICVMGMMTWLTQRVRGALPNFKLSTLCQCAEIEWDESKAHDAKYDIKKTMELFMYAKEFMPYL